MIPYGKHLVDDTDIESVVDVLRNQFLTQGTVVPRFEHALCDYTGAHYAVAVNSATSGLHIACLAAGVGQGDVVWTVANSFVASANCARFCGADVDFVDINPLTRNIDVNCLEKKLAHAQQRNALPKALIVVHFAGSSCDMQLIQQLTKPLGIVLIEDAAHALGGVYLDHKIGCCEFSDMAVLSFHPVKSITSAEGGAVLTNNKDLATSLSLFAKHGTTRDPALMQRPSDGPWYYQQIELGYNYRLSDLHAALGLSQLQKLDQYIHKRRCLARQYKQELQGLPLKLPSEDSYADSAWHLYMVELTTHDRLSVYQNLHANGIGVNVHYIPIHLQPYYQRLGFQEGDLPCTEHYYKNALTLPIFPSMSEKEHAFIIEKLKEILL
jgi:UDP-4-amino-4,6-dideoxy-N-acetyl-beta-L-altrosamine transaminase